MVYRNTLRREGGGQDLCQRLHRWESHGLLSGWIPRYRPTASLKPDLKLRGPRFPMQIVKKDLHGELLS